jgi:hypothetical protein
MFKKKQASDKPAKPAPAVPWVPKVGDGFKKGGE